MKKSKQMCGGCRNNFYNLNREGGCWCYEDAKIVTRVPVGTWEPPPYSKQRAIKCLSCYNASGYSMLLLTDQRVK